MAEKTRWEPSPPPKAKAWWKKAYASSWEIADTSETHRANFPFVCPGSAEWEVHDGGAAKDKGPASTVWETSPRGPREAEVYVGPHGDWDADQWEPSPSSGAGQRRD